MPASALQIVVHRQFDLGFALHVRIVEIELIDVGKLGEIVGHSDVAEKVCAERTKEILAHRLFGDGDRRDSQIALREQGHGFEVHVLHVIVGDFAAKPIMDLQAIRIVVLRDAEILQSRDNLFGNDPANIGLRHVLLHIADSSAEGVHRDVAVRLAVGPHHIGQEKVDVEAGAVLNERDPVSVEDVTSDCRDSNGDTRTRGNFGGVFCAARDLDIPKPKGQGRDRQENQTAKEVDSVGDMASLH